MLTRERTQLDPEEDARLAARCLAGDAQAWESLVHRHEGLVYAIGRSYRMADDDLAEVFQDVFTALYQRLPYVRDTRTLCRWLASTAERIARATALRRRRELALHTDTDRVLDEVPAVFTDPSEALEDLETQAIVRLSVDDLPERCRSLLRALYFEDPPRPYVVLARDLRIAVGSIGPTRARCFERLRTALARQGEMTRIVGAPRATSPCGDVAGEVSPLASSRREEEGDVDGS